MWLSRLLVGRRGIMLNAPFLTPHYIPLFSFLVSMSHSLGELILVVQLLMKTSEEKTPKKSFD